MYYDDEARRFNFVSGILFGAVLGTGIGLLMAPSRQQTPTRLRDGASRVRDGAAEAGSYARDAGERGYRYAVDRFGR